MRRIPAHFHRLDQGLVGSVLNNDRCMPSGAAINHVEDDVFVHEQQVALDLLVEGVRNSYIAGVGRTRSLPFPAYWTGVDDLWDELEH